MLFYKVQEVKPLMDFRLSVAFTNGEQKIYDVKPLLEKWEAFKALTQVHNLFKQVKVDKGGYGISWNDDIDLECNELYHNGISANETILM